MYIWLIAGIVLVVLEITVSGFVLLLFGLACFAAAGASAMGLGLTGQLITFAGFSLVLGSFLPKLARRLQPPPDRELKSAVDALPGKEAKVVQEIDNESDTGRIKVGGEVWSARSAGGKKLAMDLKVRIVRIEGSKAVVEEIGADLPPVMDNEEG